MDSSNLLLFGTSFPSLPNTSLAFLTTIERSSVFCWRVTTCTYIHDDTARIPRYFKKKFGESEDYIYMRYCIPSFVPFSSLFSSVHAIEVQMCDSSGFFFLNFNGKIYYDTLNLFCYPAAACWVRKIIFFKTEFHGSWSLPDRQSGIWNWELQQGNRLPSGSCQVE